MLKKNNHECRIFHANSRKIDLDNDKIIVATSKFVGEGFNMPRLSAFLLTFPLSSGNALIQRIGRLLRRHKSTINPVVYDFVDLTTPELFMRSVNEKKKIISKEFDNKCEIADVSIV